MRINVDVYVRQTNIFVRKPAYVSVSAMLFYPQPTHARRLEGQHSCSQKLLSEMKDFSENDNVFVTSSGYER